jgi:glycosyltransferase involved in cell wall biosynthesis
LSLAVIIPALNESGNLKKLLPYLNDLGGNKAYEIIVVDAALSKDDSSIICRENDVSYLRSKHTQRSIQMNEGAYATNASNLFFLHADVLPPVDFYEQITITLESGIEVGLFSYRFDSSNILLKINSLCTQFDGLFTGGGDQGQFMTRQIFERLGGYNEEWNIMEDFELWDRIKEAGISYELIRSKATVSARKYKSNSYLRVNLANLIVFLKYKWTKSPKGIKELYNCMIRS